MEAPTPTLTPADRIHLIFDELFKYVAEAVVWSDRIPIPLIKFYWRRLRHLRARFNSILARFHAGTLPPPTLSTPGSAPRRPAPPPAAPAPPADGPPPSPPADRPHPLIPPQRWGWALTIGTLVIPGYELEKAVENPELAALVASAPQLGSVLRPLCHMLAVRMPPWLRLPRRPRPSRAVKHPPPPDWLVNEPGAILKPDNSVWMHLGSSTLWKPGFGFGRTLEEARKFDPPRRIWPRD